MIRLRRTSLEYLFFFAVTILAGNVDEQSLVGCDWFSSDDKQGCTTSESKHHAPHDVCHFNSHGFEAIGMKRIERAENDTVTPKDLVWSQGTTWHRELEEARSKFYLSWPDDVPNMPYSCAFIFQQLVPTFGFPGYEEDPASNTGTCSDAMGQDCVDEIITFANSFQRNASDDSFCFHMEWAFREKEVPSCPKYFYPRGGWYYAIEYVRQSYVEETNEESESNLLYKHQQTESSCYPSFYPSASSKMMSVGYPIPYYTRPTRPNSPSDVFYAMSPILLTSWDDSDPANPRVASSLTCLKAVDNNHSLDATLHREQKEKQSQSTSSTPALLTIALCLLLSMIVTH